MNALEYAWNNSPLPGMAEAWQNAMAARNGWRNTTTPLSEAAVGSLNTYISENGANSALGMQAQQALDSNDETAYEKFMDNLLAIENTNSAREWEKMMSDTAVQRQMADLQKAGINPILAAQYGGASVPTVATAGTSSFSASGLQKQTKTSVKVAAIQAIASIVSSALKVAGSFA